MTEILCDLCYEKSVIFRVRYRVDLRVVPIAFCDRHSDYQIGKIITQEEYEALMVLEE